MKVLVLTLLALVAVASSETNSTEDEVDLEDITAYDYHSKIGIPLANMIREAEAQNMDDSSTIFDITGGALASLGQFPYQVGLIADSPKGQSVCGASLLNNRKAVTAAHCWFDGKTQVTQFTVVCGSVKLFSEGQRQVTSDVEMHKDWDPKKLSDDIAMITMVTNIDFNKNVAVIALPSDSDKSKSFAAKTATASGFGRTGDGPNHNITVAQRLSYVNLPVITNRECSKSLKNIIQSNVCTSGAGTKSPCRGDSGGPLVYTSKRRGNLRILIGIASFGSNKGCQLGYPAAFTRVTTYLKWILDRL